MHVQFTGRPKAPANPIAIDRHQAKVFRGESAIVATGGDNRHNARQTIPMTDVA